MGAIDLRNYIDQIRGYDVSDPTSIPDDYAMVWDDATKSFTYRDVNSKIGFNDIDDSSIAFEDSTRTFTITPTGTSFTFYNSDEVLYTKTESESIVIPDSTGLYLVYYNGDTLTYVSNPSRTNVLSYLMNYICISFILYQDSTSSTACVCTDIRYTRDMSVLTRANLFFETQIDAIDGFSLTDVPEDPDGTLNSDAQFGVSGGTALFCDRSHTFTTRSQTGDWKVIYLNGSTINCIEKTGFSVLQDTDFSTTTTGRLVYNNSGVPTVVPNGSYVYYVVGITNSYDQLRKVISFMGQNYYSNQATAKAALADEIAAIETAFDIRQEFRSIYAILYRTADAYTNDVNAIIVDTYTIISPSGAISAGSVPAELVDGSATTLHTHEMENIDTASSGTPDTSGIVYRANGSGGVTKESVTGDIVGTTEVQSLTNKVINADNNTVSNIGKEEIKAGILTDQTEAGSPSSSDFILVSISGVLYKAQIGNLPTAATTFLALTDTPSGYTAGYYLKVNDTGTALELVTAPDGEPNTASNIGTGGVGVYVQKVGDDLQFKTINAGSSKVTITDDTDNDEIDIDISESNITHANISGVGTNTHTQIDTHIASTSNPHSVTKDQVGLGNVVNLDTTNASNITSGTLPSSVLPPVALTTVAVYASEATMLAATTEEGDVAVRSDENKTYMHNGGSSGTMSDWTELQTPTDSVLSVNGETGTVVLTQDDVGDGSTYVRTTNDYTSTEKSKLAGIESGAEVNNISDTNAGYLTGGTAITIHKHALGNLDGNLDDISNGTSYVKSENNYTDAEKTKLSGIETGAEVNNISDADASELTGAADSDLHYHESDRNRANHTGTQTASTISDFDTEVANNTTVAANTAARHSAVTVADTTEIDLTLSGQQISASLKSGSIDEGKLDTSVNASLDLADSAVQPGDLATIATTGALGDASGDLDDIADGTTYVKSTNDYTDAEKTKLSGIETGAEVNNISDTNATDLTDGGASTLHYHVADRARANHTGTQTASTISDFDTEVSNNTDVSANTSARHVAVTVVDTDRVDLTLSGQQITADIVASSISEGYLNSSVNASLDLADSAIQSGDLATVATSGSHTDLSNIGTNTHTQIDSHISSTSNPHSVTSTQVGLGSVTNDAQLKRAASDIYSFTEKTTPVDADIIIIEDSAASYAKKKVQISNLPSGGGSGTPAPLRFFSTGVVTQGIVGTVPKLCEAGTISSMKVLFGGLPQGTFDSSDYIEFNVYKADMSVPTATAPSWTEISSSSTRINSSTLASYYVQSFSLTSTTLTSGDLVKIEVIIAGTTVTSMGTDLQIMIEYDS